MKFDSLPSFLLTKRKYMKFLSIRCFDALTALSQSLSRSWRSSSSSLLDRSWKWRKKRERLRISLCCLFLSMKKYRKWISPFLIALSVLTQNIWRLSSLTIIAQNVINPRQIFHYLSHALRVSSLCGHQLCVVFDGIYIYDIFSFAHVMMKMCTICQKSPWVSIAQLSRNSRATPPSRK